MCDTPCTCRSVCENLYVPHHPGLSRVVQAPWIVSSFWWLTHCVHQHHSPSWTSHDLQGPGGTNTQLVYYYFSSGFVSWMKHIAMCHTSWTKWKKVFFDPRVVKDHYLRQAPLRLRAVSQIVEGLPSIIHRLDPLLHNKHVLVKDDS